MSDLEQAARQALDALNGLDGEAARDVLRAALEQAEPVVESDEPVVPMDAEIVHFAKTALHEMPRPATDWHHCAKRVCEAVVAAQQAEPVAEPVALLKGFPEGTTHVAGNVGHVVAGGEIRFSFSCFKYVEGVLKVYTTDSENEYPGWIDASRGFFKPPKIVPLKPAQAEPVALTVVEIEQMNAQWNYEIHGDRTRYLVRMTEKAHGIGEKE